MKSKEEIEALALELYPKRGENIVGMTALLNPERRQAFIKCYEMTQPKWISVEDELPDAGVEVYVLYFPKSPVMEGLVYGLMKRITHKTAITFNSLDSNGFTSLGGVVKYWMPKPPKPTK
jgi:hypothetical protein